MSLIDPTVCVSLDRNHLQRIVHARPSIARKVRRLLVRNRGAAFAAAAALAALSIVLAPAFAPAAPLAGLPGEPAEAAPDSIEPVTSPTESPSDFDSRMGSLEQLFPADFAEPVAR